MTRLDSHATGRVISPVCNPLKKKKNTTHNFGNLFFKSDVKFALFGTLRLIMTGGSQDDQIMPDWHGRWAALLITSVTSRREDKHDSFKQGTFLQGIPLGCRDVTHTNIIIVIIIIILCLGTEGLLLFGFHNVCSASVALILQEDAQL